MSPTLAFILDSFVLPSNLLAARGFPTAASPGHAVTSPRSGARRLVALDCEMCVTTAGIEPLRVTAVDGDGAALLDMKVAPAHPVLDWHTEHNGLTERDFVGVTARLDDAQRALLALVAEDTLLVGHGLDNDLRALKVAHGRCVDTLFLYDSGAGLSRRVSLRHLARKHLGRLIQRGSHDSVEDARAALDLVMLRARQVAPTRRNITPPARTTTEAPALDALLDHFGLEPSRVLNVYPFGSRVYGTHAPSSDHDYIVVTDLDVEVEEHLARDDVNAALYDRGSFARLLDGCSVWALECMFLPEGAALKESLDLRAHVRLEPTLLRESVCMEAGYAWSKAQRLFRAGDVYRARKNVFHALRFLEYGLQLARHGRITDYGAANHHLAAMRAMEAADRAAHRARYQPVYRALKREFCKLVPYGARHVREPAPNRSPSPPRPPSPVPGAGGDSHELAPVSGPPAPGTGEGAGGERVGGKLRDFLREHGPDALVQRYAVTARSHREHPSLVQLSYTPESPDDEIVAACRGVILDASDDWSVVAMPYARFYNHGEPGATDIDWGSARVYEKLDGSLAMLYPHRGRWHVASRNSPDGSGNMGWYSLPAPVPFATLFWDIWEMLGYRRPTLPDAGGARRCYLFEMVTNRHQIVVRHDEEALVLHGARDLDTLDELDPVAVAREHGWRHPRVVGGVASFEALRAMAEGLNPMRAEGFVVCDAAFRRVKVKSSRYVQLSMTLHGAGRKGSVQVSPRQMIDLVRNGATEEFLAYFPEYTERFREAVGLHRAMCDALAGLYARLESLDAPAFGRATNALRGVDRSLPRLMFCMRRGMTAGEALRAAPLEHVERLGRKLTHEDLLTRVAARGTLPHVTRGDAVMDYQEIYAQHADRYDALVEAEDCDRNLLPALEAVAKVRGARVLEVGVGTGRITRLIAPLARSIVGVERSPTMLAIAKRHLADAPSCELMVGDAVALPVASGMADVAVAGWVFGHFRHWMPDGWREEITRAFEEMKRVLVPGGTIVIIETLGTGRAEPSPPNEALAEYYTWLEHVHGFTRVAIRTDYLFPDVERAAEVTGFFFGEAFARRVRQESWARVPECTGVWSKHLRPPR